MADQKKGYGKRPLWQWVLIYLVIGGVVYYGIYYFYSHRSSSSGTGSSQHSLY